MISYGNAIRVFEKLRVSGEIRFDFRLHILLHTKGIKMLDLTATVSSDLFRDRFDYKDTGDVT